LAAVAAPQREPEDGQSRNPLVMAVKSSLLAESTTLLREKEVLGCLAGCPEVVACYGDDVTVEADGRRFYNVFLEYVPGGTLSELCRRTPLPEEEVRRYTASILRGLRRVHEAGYVHCDVKPQNVLVAGKGRAKIADFGLAKLAGEKVGAGGARRGGAFLRGTPLYMAPESVARGEHEPPSDVWSLGCVVAEMATGEPAWRCADAAALVFRIGSGEEVPEVPLAMSDEGKDFLRKCLDRDPTERWTAAMLLGHPFVAGAVVDDEDSSSADDKSPESCIPGPSPRSIFAFPSWASSSPLPSLCSTPTPSQESNSPVDTLLGPANRLRHLTTGSPAPDWSSASCCWTTVRERSLAVQAEPPQDPPLVLLQRMIEEEEKNRERPRAAEPAATGTSSAGAVERVLLPPPASSSQELQLRPPPMSSDDWVSEGEGNFRRSRENVDHGSSLPSPSSARQPWRDVNVVQILMSRADVELQWYEPQSY
ncbi:hypothetical protein Taro_007483, partial [Colocasia esculenta]|nr:hypothetical protein [Colocasia esculenta]